MNITRRFGVLGRSLAYSQSPALFADRFKAWGINDASYERFERANLEGFGEDAWTHASAPLGEDYAQGTLGTKYCASCPE